mmetsp:Transcript_8248/g.25034  ORF Transcript_8248/g.25034 Transcript_8248/m.25034 type:complete len:226 (+) Transcript_8248:310-987(+)
MLPHLIVALTEVLAHRADLARLALHPGEVLIQLVMLPLQVVLVALARFHVKIALPLGPVGAGLVAVHLQLKSLHLLVQAVGALLLVQSLELAGLVFALQVLDPVPELRRVEVHLAHLALRRVQRLLLGGALLEKLNDPLLRLQLRLLVQPLQLRNLVLQGLPLRVGDAIRRLFELRSKVRVSLVEVLGAPLHVLLLQALPHLGLQQLAEVRLCLFRLRLCLFRLL